MDKTLEIMLKSALNDNDRARFLQWYIQTQGPLNEKDGEAVRALFVRGDPFPSIEDYHCRRCGKKLHTNAKHCGYCGEMTPKEKQEHFISSLNAIINSEEIKLLRIEKTYNIEICPPSDMQKELITRAAADELAALIIRSGLMEIDFQQDNEHGLLKFSAMIRVLDKRFRFGPML